MRLLANENVPGALIRKLRAQCHDVLSAKESLRGQPDDVVLARARLDGRLVLTFDKDFGELAFHAGLPAECGVILFRLRSHDPADLVDRVLDLLEGRSDWVGSFTVVTDRRIRVRPLPGVDHRRRGSV